MVWENPTYSCLFLTELYMTFYLYLMWFKIVMETFVWKITSISIRQRGNEVLAKDVSAACVVFDCWSYMCGSVSGWSPQKALKRTSGVSCKWQTSFFRQSLIPPRSSHPSCAVCAIVYIRYACSGCLPLSFGVGLWNSSSLFVCISGSFPCAVHSGHL